MTVEKEAAGTTLSETGGEMDSRVADDGTGTLGGVEDAQEETPIPGGGQSRSSLLRGPGSVADSYDDYDTASYQSLPQYGHGVSGHPDYDVVMTACKRGSESVIRIERVPKNEVDFRKVHHVGGGPLRGIVINKATRDLLHLGNAQIRMSFSVSLKNRRSHGRPTKEDRELNYWFKPGTSAITQQRNAREYFDMLIQPENFPRDYVNFIKKAVVLTKSFPDLRCVEVVLKAPVPLTADETDSPYVETAEERIYVHSPPPVVAAPGLNASIDEEPEREQRIDDEMDLEDQEQNFITVLTPALYDYQYLPEVPVSNKTWIHFRVRGKADAHIALSSVYGDTERKTYEVVIGGWNNTRSVIRDGGQGHIVEDAVTLNILSGYEFRPFWVSWDRGVVRVGEGTRKGTAPFLVWHVPENKRHGVNCIAVSSGPGSDGEWEFVEYISKNRWFSPRLSRGFVTEPSQPRNGTAPLRPEEQTKSARKAKVRTSLLWLAKKQKMLQVLEDCYPNSMDTGELLRLSNIKLHDMMTAVVFLRDLQKRGLITEVTKGIWMRAPGGQKDQTHVVKVVHEMPVLPLKDSPSVAIICSQFCEKLAVDAMMENKISYIIYKQGGDSHVYTIGKIGHHNVVSTKLSRIGSSRTASVAAGNSTHRMLNIFDRVEHCFVVGAGGSVPNYMDYNRHVRLGDIVVSTGGEAKGAHEYIHCDTLDQTDGSYEYHTHWWRCRNTSMTASLDQMRALNSSNTSLTRPWERFIQQGLEILHAEESNFHRPAIKTDKLYAEIDGKLVQVEHPKSPYGQDHQLDNQPRVRYGPIGSGRYVARNQSLRMDFGRKYGIVAYVQEFDAVMDALDRNHKDSFLFIRGISDYIDGSRLKEWQPYASLAAAAFMKAIVVSLPAPRRFSGYMY